MAINQINPINHDSYVIPPLPHILNIPATLTPIQLLNHNDHHSNIAADSPTPLPFSGWYGMHGYLQEPKTAEGQCCAHLLTGIEDRVMHVMVIKCQ